MRRRMISTLAGAALAAGIRGGGGGAGTDDRRTPGGRVFAVSRPDRPLKLMLAVACCLGLLAPSASAKPRYRQLPMLSKRTCRGLASYKSFPGATEEIAATVSGSDGNYGSTCAFVPDPEALGKIKELREQTGMPQAEGGFILLGVDDRVTYETRGKEHNLALAFPFPAGTPHNPLRIGDHAYWGKQPESIDFLGVVQVRNDVAEVGLETTGSGGRASVEALLESIAHQLCPRCAR